MSTDYYQIAKNEILVVLSRHNQEWSGNEHLREPYCYGIIRGLIISGTVSKDEVRSLSALVDGLNSKR